MTMPTRTPTKGEPLGAHEAHALGLLVAELGDVEIARAAGVSRLAIARAVAGLAVYRRTRQRVRALLGASRLAA